MAALARQIADAMRRDGDTRVLLALALEVQGAVLNDDERRNDDAPRSPHD
jgi:hypothetical protein